jgi:cell pole-organizing protein PopZ
MNAVTAPIPNPKSAEARAHEPSMEEILASIRRIIADDQALPLTPRPPAANLRAVAAEPAARAPSPPEPPRRAARPQPEGGEAEFMSKLAASISSGKANAAKSAPSAVPASPEVETRKAASWSGSSEEAGAERLPSASNVEPSAAPRAQEAAVDAPDERPQAAVPQSVPTAAAISAMPSDNKLLSPATDASVASSFNALATTIFIQNSGQIEQAVHEMLRPMLQRWLDDNLPMMVERLVRAEIERVARGGKS